MARGSEIARARAPGGALARLYARSTGFKLFAILSLALLPLGLIAFFATLQSNRTTDEENRAQMRVALTESSHKLASALAADIAFARIQMRVDARDPASENRCLRLRQLFAVQQERAPRFALFDVASTPWCATPGFAPARPSTLSADGRPQFELGQSDLVITVPGAGGAAVTVLEYPVEVLLANGAPGGMLTGYTLSLLQPGAVLPLVSQARRGGLAGYETLTMPIGGAALAVEMTVARTPFSAPEIIAILLPLIMWFAAAVIGWLVVNRVLIRPLRRLELAVSAYRPGDIIPPLSAADNSAHELRQLSETFHTITLRISSHEAELADGLARQTRLTREVHHRVKNNLQVVASLISLHARGQATPEVIRAYASIQRRVDALAVVHRNHFAELEENRGIGLRSLIGELAQNIRGSVPEGEVAPAISIGVAAAYVSQDVAVPVAFLITELVELSMLTQPRAAIAITFERVGEGRGRLAVTSLALAEICEITSRRQDRISRVLDGLSRQLRSPLECDAEVGKFSLELPVLGLDD